jgi:hypothetical protein
MTPTEKKQFIASEMINKFTKDFKRRTGLNVMINLYGDNQVLHDFSVSFEENYPIITLRELENLILESLPETINSEKFRSKSREREYVDVRSIFSYVARRFNFKYATIGKYLNKDHTTIIHHQKIAENLLETDPIYKSKYEHIVNKINEKYDKVI